MKSVGRKGISPLAATAFLIAFAIVLGTVVMGLGRNYIETLNSETSETAAEFCVTLPHGDPLAVLQTEYLTGELSRGEYLEKERALLSSD